MQTRKQKRRQGDVRFFDNLVRWLNLSMSKFYAQYKVIREYQDISKKITKQRWIAHSMQANLDAKYSKKCCLYLSFVGNYVSPRSIETVE